MDHAIELTVNVTEYERESKHSLNHTIHTWVLIIASVVALLSDIVMITTILRSRRLQNKRNLVLLHWAAIDIGFISFTPTLPLMSFLTNVEMHAVVSCTVSNLQVILLFAQLLLVTTLLSNTLMKSKTITVEAMLIVVYVIVVVTAVILTWICAAYVYNFVIFHFVILLMFVFILLQVIVEGVYKFCKRKTSPVSPSAIVRLNIGRIYIYNLLIAGVFIVFANVPYAPLLFTAVTKFCAITGVLGSFYIILYLTEIDEDFKNGITGLFKRNANNVEENDETPEYTTVEGVRSCCSSEVDNSKNNKC